MIQTDLRAQLYTYKIIHSIPFYAGPHSKMTRIRIYSQPRSINFTLISGDQPKRNSDVPICSLTQSVVYISEYNFAICATYPSVDGLLLDQVRPFNTIKISTIKSPDPIKIVDVAATYRQVYPSFGHMIRDMIGCLSFLPREVLENECYVLSCGIPRSTQKQWFEFLHWNLTIIPDNAAYIARKLYMVNPTFQVHEAGFGGMENLRRRVRELYPIDQIKATKYVIINRDVRRYFLNFYELCDAIKKNTQIEEGCQWTNYTHNAKNITENCFMWAEYKVVVTGCGSNIFNAMFMKHRTGICLAFCDKLDDPNMQILCSSRIFMTAVVHNNYNHDEYKGFNCNIKMMVKQTQNVIDAVRLQKWTNTDGLRQYFNIKELELCPAHKINPRFVDESIEIELIKEPF